jgi:outer membrane protein assembly factor BamB
MKTLQTKAGWPPGGWIATTCICVLMLLVGSGFAAGDAQQILDATGVKGGLIVHVGCGDGRLTAGLRANDSFLVHGLDAEAKNIEQARKHISSLGLYGNVSVDRLAGSRLPYIDNLVNLVVCDNLGNVTMDEVMRVLAPNGVAYIKKADKWTKTVKPRPEQMDEWTHYWRDADGNPVAHDTLVGPPRRLQWECGPRWARHHDHMGSMSALVSTGGRIFYIMDEGSKASIQLPAKWFLVARDAFNGTILWKRPIAEWFTHLWPLKSGPALVTRRLVAVCDRVYVTLGLDAPLTALDAATGGTIRTYKDSKTTEEVIASQGVLFLVVTESAKKVNEYFPKHTYVWDNTTRANRDWAWDETDRRVMAVRADTGEALWEKTQRIVPLTLTADAKRVYFHDGEKVIGLDRNNGAELWSSEPQTRRDPVSTSFGPRLVVQDDIVVFAGGTRSMAGLSAETGKTLWTAKHPRSGHASPEDILVVDGLVWSGAVANGKDSGIFTGLDLHTGQVKNEFPPDVETYWFHHRCYPSKATDLYLLPSRTGIEFVDFRKGHWTANHWVRGGCIYGIMPCNGLVYAPPQSCGCYLESKLNGFSALAPASARDELPKISAEDRLERGPAYGKSETRSSKVETPAKPGDWPTYRHDASRSGFTQAAVPAKLETSWQKKLGGKLSSIVVADGRLFAASVDTHTVYSLDAVSGKALWSFTAGGRVDSPPTIYQGGVLFGSADGYVYRLRATDGQLAWRFLAAPADRRTVSYDQIESLWPVHGSVLVENGSAYCVAGRSMFLDGGMRLVQLDAGTGRLICNTVLDDRDPQTGENLQIYVKGLTMPVALPDILSSDGQHVYMRSQRFDLGGNRQQIAPSDVTEQAGEGAHLFCTTGFLDDSWFHRSYWMYGRSTMYGWGGWFRAGRYVPSGRILVFDDSGVYGYGRKPEYMAQSSVLEYQIYAADREIEDESIRRVVAAEARMNADSKKQNASAADWKHRQNYPLADRTAISFKWADSEPTIHPRAMVLAGKTLFVAGPPDVVDEEKVFFNPEDPELQAKLREQDAALEGKKGALLQVVSASDGKKLAEYKLDTVPVWDGMAAANGRLYLSTMDGRILCMGEK